MNKGIVFLLSVIVASTTTMAQVKIGDNPGIILPGSVLELESTSKALVLPRMTTPQMQAIPFPVNGMVIFNTDSNCIYLYKNGAVWASISSNVVAPQNQVWPYRTNDQVVSAVGNGEGIVASTGSGLVASGDYSHSEGLNSLASGGYSWSSGYADTAINTASVAMGYQNKATGEYSFALGYKNVAAYQASVSFGQENYDSGWASLAMGLRNRIANQVPYSNALGYNNQIKGGVSNNILGERNTINNGKGNSVLGFSNISNGNYNTLSGQNNQILLGNSNSSVVSGESNTIKSGNANMLFGLNNIAEGSYLAAMGKENIVFYQSAAALGQGNRDSGWASVAAGLSNIIEKDVQYSSSLGYHNLSTRNYALGSTIAGSGTFSAGINNINSGYASVAIGASCKPSNAFSLAANYNTLANSNAMSAFGHYNDTIPAYQGESYAPSEMLFSIGNGTGTSARRNSFTMLRNGFTTINASSSLGPNEPRAELDVKGTGAIIVPVGTSDQRPATPVVGMIRFCSNCKNGNAPVLQGYNGTAWVDL